MEKEEQKATGGKTKSSSGVFKYLGSSFIFLLKFNIVDFIGTVNPFLKYILYLCFYRRVVGVL